MIRGELIRKGVAEDDITWGLQEVFGTASNLDLRNLEDREEVMKRKQAAIDRVRNGIRADVNTEHGHEERISPEEELIILEEEERQLNLTEELVAAAKRYLEGSRGQSKERRKAKLIAFLQRRRHGWNTIRAVLDQIEL